MITFQSVMRKTRQLSRRSVLLWFVSCFMVLTLDKGFFVDEGVDVELKEFTAGKFALLVQVLT